MVDKELAKANYYHGLLPREDIKEMLIETGDWLLRLTEPSAPGKRDFVLSVQTEKEHNLIKHFIITKKEGKFTLIDSKMFDSIVQLMEHYMKEPIGTKPPITLAKAISRQRWELDHDDIECTKKLGEGAFGEVHKGKLRKRKKSGKVKFVNVAIKLAKLDALTKEQIKEIMREARLMRNFNHPNVVKLHGVAAGQEPLMLVMELATDGALDSYLSKRENLPHDKRVEMTCQAAWGIEYLHNKNCIHRDVAARNCLYGNGNVKISDFGLSRCGEKYQMNPKNKVPIRWLAPETLKSAMYTRKSDVWSYAVMVWEIFNNGAEPYPGMTTLEVLRFVKGGKHLDLQEKMENKALAEMLEKRCFEHVEEERWSMTQVVKELEMLTPLKQHTPEIKETQDKTMVCPAPAVPAAVVVAVADVPTDRGTEEVEGMSKMAASEASAAVPGLEQSTTTSKQRKKKKKQRNLHYIQ